MLIIGAFSIMGIAQNIHIDHVITVVDDLDKSVESWQQKGFTVKPGRLHANGLKNAHIKFKNGSSLELMSISEEPRDAIARNYQKLLKEGGEGIVFIALTGISTDSMELILSQNNIPHETIKGKAWNYITFPDMTGLAHFFFIESFIKVKDTPTTLTHPNQSTGINEVIVEGDKRLIQFLTLIGLKPSPNQQVLQPFQTSTGKIIIIPQKNPSKRPRISSVSFTKND